MRPRLYWAAITPILIAVMLVNVYASAADFQGQLEQPLLGFAWPLREIPVIVQKWPDYAHATVLEAMHNWNLLQVWFADKYGVQSRPYRFVEVDGASGNYYIVVSFNQTQTTDSLSRSRYNVHWSDAGVPDRIIVSISFALTLSSGAAPNPDILNAVVAHHFGHALGLAHTKFSDSDLMYSRHDSMNTVRFPSTLNLYAVALLSMANLRADIPKSPVTLTQGFPYFVPSGQILPFVISSGQATVTTTSTSTVATTAFTTTTNRMTATSVQTALIEVRGTVTRFLLGSAQGTDSYALLILIIVNIVIGALVYRAVRVGKKAEPPGTSNERKEEKARSQEGQGPSTSGQTQLTYCSKCGGTIDQSAKFCPECGVRL